MNSQVAESLVLFVIAAGYVWLACGIINACWPHKPAKVNTMRRSRDRGRKPNAVTVIVIRTNGNEPEMRTEPPPAYQFDRWGRGGNLN